MDLFSAWTRKPVLINFDKVKEAIRLPHDFIIINVLPTFEQGCLIAGTTDAMKEESILNDMMSSLSVADKKIIVYGKHCNDENVSVKVQQLQILGIKDLFVYRGGLFEWMLLQDIYGHSEFPTTSRMNDILQFKPK